MVVKMFVCNSVCVYMCLMTVLCSDIKVIVHSLNITLERLLDNRHMNSLRYLI